MVRKFALAITCMFLFVFAKAQRTQVLQAMSDFRSDSVLYYVKVLAGDTSWNNQTILTRYAGTGGNELSFQFIKTKCLEWGLTVDSFGFNVTGENLFAIHQGTYSDKYVMIGAHYDAVGPGNQFVRYPGADDNGSGTAAVMEAARVLSRYDFPFTIKFVFWDEEEEGLRGSYAYLPPDDKENFMGYINLDMIAWDGNNDSLFEIHTRPIASSMDLSERAKNVVDTYGLPLKYKLVNPGESSTDNYAFWVSNMTAIAVNEEYQGNDFNPHWHTPLDSVKDFNLPYFFNMSKYALALVADIAMDTVNVLAVPELFAKGTKRVMVYPNPVHDRLIFYLQENLQQATIEIYDPGGKKVMNIPYSPEISLGELAQGFYIGFIKSKSGNYHFNFVK